MINGANILSIEFRLANNNFPWLAKIQNIARDRKKISRFANKWHAFSFKSLSKINFVICAAVKGITIIINMEYRILI